MTATVLTIIVLLLGLISQLMKGYYAKQETQQTPQALYEKDKQNIDEVLASGDLTRNDQLLDDLLPPPDSQGNSGSGDNAK